tara:strand:+ start:764 stop:973 length:210 start_codon:yes stop_codon:yes gene_type:complete
MLLFLLCNGFRIIVLRDARNLAVFPVLYALFVALRFSFLSSSKVATEYGMGLVFFLLVLIFDQVRNYSK